MFEVTYIETRTKIVCKEVVYADNIVDAYNKVYKKDINNIVQVTNVVLQRNLERL